MLDVGDGIGDVKLDKLRIVERPFTNPLQGCFGEIYRLETAAVKGPFWDLIQRGRPVDSLYA